MQQLVNRQWLLIKRPVGLPKSSDFEYCEVAIPEPGKGEILLQILYALVDPAQRGWMDAEGNYWDPSPLGEPVRSGILAKVVKSESEQHPVGQFVMGVGVARFCRSAGRHCRPTSLRWKPGHQSLLACDGY